MSEDNQEKDDATISRMHDRLEQLEEDIERARDSADEALDPIDDDDGQTYVESGDVDSEMDDQTITPPG